MLSLIKLLFFLAHNWILNFSFLFIVLAISILLNFVLIMKSHTSLCLLYSSTLIINCINLCLYNSIARLLSLCFRLFHFFIIALFISFGLFSFHYFRNIFTFHSATRNFVVHISLAIRKETFYSNTL